MSWQSYIDDNLMLEIAPGQALSAAAIVGQDGNVWAQSADFPQLLDGEIDNIVKGMTDSSELAQHGLFLGGLKYMVVQGEAGQVIRGKKGTGGVTVKKTNSALVIGIYETPMTGPNCNVVVERLGDYLYDQGI